MDGQVSRLSYVSDSSGTLEGYNYLGDSTVLVVTRRNNVVGTTTLDSFGNVQNLNWTQTGTTPATFDDFNYAYDANDNVLSSKFGADRFNRRLVLK